MAKARARTTECTGRVYAVCGFVQPRPSRRADFARGNLNSDRRERVLR